MLGTLGTDPRAIPTGYIDIDTDLGIDMDIEIGIIPNTNRGGAQMVILFGGEKGGTGKSTLATNLAAYLARERRDVVVVDTDTQRSAASWVTVRSDNADLSTVHCIEKLGDVLKTIRDLATRYEEVIVDAGGRDSRELRSAMLAADKMYVPIKASQFDLWTVDRMNALVDQSRGFNQGLQAYALISMASTNPVVNEAQEAQDMLSDFDQLALAKTIIRERKVYRDAIMEGKGVIECSNPKAYFEIEELAQEIYNGIF